MAKSTAPSTPNGKGRPRDGQKISNSLAQAWNAAEELNKRREQFGQAGEYVPTEAIWVREELLPRIKHEDDTIRRYAHNLDQMPPIHVQKDTFALLDGLGRLTAAGFKPTAHIRIVEVDLPESQLADYAAQANLRHGMPLTLKERQASGLKMYERHHPDTGGTSGEAWSPALIAERSGVDERTVQRWAARDRAAATKNGTPEPPKPATRTGKDGTTRRVQGATGNARKRPDPAPVGAPNPDAYRNNVTALRLQGTGISASAIGLLEQVRESEESKEAFLATFLEDDLPYVAEAAEKMVAFWAWIRDEATRLAPAPVAREPEPEVTAEPAEVTA